MSNRAILRKRVSLKVLAIVLLLASLAAWPVELIVNDTIVAEGVSPAQREADLKAAQAFYGFWNTGDQTLLDRALAPTLTDHTLPLGRPQDPSGPAFASTTFRAAVPELGVTVENSSSRAT